MSIHDGVTGELDNPRDRDSRCLKLESESVFWNVRACKNARFWPHKYYDDTVFDWWSSSAEVLFKSNYRIY